MSVARRLAWRCRRGMKELDLLLEPFARDALPSLDTRLHEPLARLLDLPDQQLLAVLGGDDDRGDGPRCELVGIIRAARGGAGA